MSFCVYILFSEKLNRFYTGTTDDIEKRLVQHNTSHFKDAFTHKGIPWSLFLLIHCNSSKQAYAIEAHIKKMRSSKYKENLKLYPELIENLKSRYA